MSAGRPRAPTHRAAPVGRPQKEVPLISPTVTPPVSQDQLHAGFLALLPRVERACKVALRLVRSAEERAELAAEAVALAWCWYRRLVLRGRDPSAFDSALAALAVRAARSGRRLCGQEPADDVLSTLARRRRGFAVLRLPASDVPGGRDWWAEALQDKRATPQHDQVAFRLDFPAWLGRCSRRNRRIIAGLAVGDRTGDVARRQGLSPARISQLRRQLK